MTQIAATRRHSPLLQVGAGEQVVGDMADRLHRPGENKTLSPGDRSPCEQRKDDAEQRNPGLNGNPAGSGHPHLPDGNLARLRLPDMLTSVTAIKGGPC